MYTYYNWQYVSELAEAVKTYNRFGDFILSAGEMIEARVYGHVVPLLFS